MKYHYNPPALVKKLFNSFQWESESSKILITFDDGPNPSTTEIILKELENQKIKSIFFCVGENLESYTGLAKEILSAGHDIGNHTQKHERIRNLNWKEAITSINQVQDYAQNNMNCNIRYFRPPHGRFNLSTKKILKETSLTNVMWSLLSHDYKNDLNIVKFALANYLKQNSIIVMHDSNKSKNIIVDSIKLIVDEANKKNYQIGTPAECLKYYS